MVAAVLHNQVRVLVGNSSLTWLEEVGRGGGSEAATASTASGGWGLRGGQTAASMVGLQRDTLRPMSGDLA
jgi:hypothetical protein